MPASAEAKGVSPEDYDGPRWIDRLSTLRTGAASDSDLARFDVALTVSAMRYISDLHFGKANPKLFQFLSDSRARKYDLDIVLRDIADTMNAQEALDRVEPAFEGYKRTRKALQSYLRLVQEDRGEFLPALSKPLKPGEPYAGLSRLTCLLRHVGDLSLSAVLPRDTLVYAGALVDAVKRFQFRHGLDPDGLIGKSTIHQLNTPFSGRVRQLQLTLERWRWVPQELTGPAIVVNIPEFRLRAFSEPYRPELEMRVVVGKAYGHRTPVFAAQLKYLVFRPYWNVPLSIQRAELIPALERDPSYLSMHDYEIVKRGGDVVTDGRISELLLAQLRAGELLIRQKPGGNNALGRVKFVFPNENNVYLHDTPAQALFSKSRRDFSHGCIRIEKPQELAKWVLRQTSEWSDSKIADAMRTAHALQVNLNRPIPVLIVYATAVVVESGEVRFFEDIYGYDASLEAQLRETHSRAGSARAGGGSASTRPLRSTDKKRGPFALHHVLSGQCGVADRWREAPSALCDCQAVASTSVEW